MCRRIVGFELLSVVCLLLSHHREAGGEILCATNAIDVAARSHGRDGLGRGNDRHYQPSHLRTVQPESGLVDFNRHHPHDKRSQ